MQRGREEAKGGVGNPRRSPQARGRGKATQRRARGKRSLGRYAGSPRGQARLGQAGENARREVGTRRGQGGVVFLGGEGVSPARPRRSPQAGRGRTPPGPVRFRRVRLERLRVRERAGVSGQRAGGKGVSRLRGPTGRRLGRRRGGRPRTDAQRKVRRKKRRRRGRGSRRVVEGVWGGLGRGRRLPRKLVRRRRRAAKDRPDGECSSIGRSPALHAGSCWFEPNHFQEGVRENGRKRRKSTSRRTRCEVGGTCKRKVTAVVGFRSGGRR